MIAGAVAVALLLGVAGTAGAYWLFLRSIGDDVSRLTSAARAPGIVVTEAMLAALPPPAQRYFRYAGVVGREVPAVVRLTQTGRIRGSADAAWMTFEASETYSTNPPAFIWQAFMPGRMTPAALGRDEYLDGRGSILMKLLALMPVADEHGDQLTEAGLMRYLNECMWFPAALLGPNMTIAAIDDASFEVVLAERDREAKAAFVVDEEGRLTNFRAIRYNTSTRSDETWETPITAYRDYGGLRLPSAGAAVWKLAGGDLSYIELEVGNIGYE
jgi:hypothetical protein